VLGEAATDQVIDAWGEAYNALSKHFIEAEAKLYKKNEFDSPLGEIKERSS